MHTGVSRTIGSVEPCPFCGCTCWVSWFVGGAVVRLDEEALLDPAPAAIVDRGSDDLGMQRLALAGDRAL